MFSLHTRSTCRLLGLFGVLSLGSSELWAYETGPPPDRVGLCSARPTCKESGCHVEDSFSAVSDLQFDAGGSPTVYRMDELMRLVISVVDSDPTRFRFGFEVGVVSDCPLPTQAGTLAVYDTVRTQMVSDSGLDFIEHNIAGIVPSAPGNNAWTFDWRAPPGYVEAVTFYWAINSADGDSTEMGDRISLWQHTVDPACPGRIEQLLATKSICDPAEPGVLKVQTNWDSSSWSRGYRVYTTDDAAVLQDPGGLGAGNLAEPPTTAACIEPATFFTVVGRCEDGSDGEP